MSGAGLGSLGRALVNEELAAADAGAAIALDPLGAALYPILELGEPFLGTGPLDPGFEMPGGSVWQPSLLLYGTYRTALMGNINVMVLETGDKDLIRKEVEGKLIPLREQRVPYVFHSDHSLSPQVTYDAYRYALDIYHELRNY